MSDEGSRANPMNNVLVLALVVAAFAIGILYTKVQMLEKNAQQLAAASPAPQQMVAGAEQNAPQAAPGPETEPIAVAGVTSFQQKKDAQICKENGKPVAYLFSTTWCHHCQWIKDTFDKVANEYVASGKVAAYHWDIDVNDDVLTATKETAFPADHNKVYTEFNPQGSIPTFVFGCKYFRVGNGFESQKDLAAEEKEFRLLFDELIKG